MARDRVKLIEAQPSVAFSGRVNGSAREKTLLEGTDGISVMFNTDGSLVIEVFDRDRRIGLRISPEDAKAHAPDFRRWSTIR
jgi:hypothetical protein